MSIGLITSPLTSLVSASSSSDTTPAAPASQSALDSGTGTGTSSAAFRQVASQYNIHDISPREFSSLIQQLAQSGAISSSDQQELTQMRVELDVSGAQPDEPLDLVQFFQKKSQSVSDTAASTSSTATAAYTSTAQRQLEWAQKFATIQTSSDTGGIDTMA